MVPTAPRRFDENMASVTVTFEDTGETVELTTRPGSGHHFFERLAVGDDEVQLRLDWSDLDSNGQPMLDADFINPENGRHRPLHGERKAAHHTESDAEDTRRYEWEFKGFSRRFTVAVTWRLSIADTAHVISSCTVKLIPGSADPKRHG